MASSQLEKQLRKMISDPDVLEHAREMLNLAKAKTGTGSGHDLGTNAIGLPAICAYLASQRLGSNDISEKVAQQASCLAPKAFNATVTTVRSALSTFLGKRNSTRHLTYETLARRASATDDAVYWMKEAEDELKESGAMDTMEVRDDALKCAVYRWTFRLLKISVEPLSDLCSDFGLLTRDLTVITGLLEDHCSNTRASMATRNKVDSKEDIMVENQERPRLKRKASVTATLLQTPTKKNKSSPLKLNRLPVTLSPTKAALQSPSKRSTRGYASSQSPSKSVAEIPSVTQTPTKSKIDATISPSKTGLLESTTGPRRSPRTPKRPTPFESPTKSVVEKVTRMSIADPGDQRSSPRKATSRLAGKSPITDVSTPIRGRGRAPRLQSPSEEHDDETGSEDDHPRPCRRHRRPPFLDRHFYTYRDPRAVKEWELCTKHIEELVKKFGLPTFGREVIENPRC